jgi:ribonuclease Z
VVSDDAMISWLEEYSAVEDFGFSKVLPLTAHPEVSGSHITTEFTYRHRPDGVFVGRRTAMSFNNRFSPLTSLLKSTTGLENLLTCRVKHCKGALAVSLVFPNGFKISYSGDCRPSAKFASIGQGSTVLIHEATFGPDMVGSAMAKRHSTSAEAIEVGRRMQARAILLTHFSQRYQKLTFVDNRKADVPQSARDASAKEPADADIPFDDPQDQQASTDTPLPDDLGSAMREAKPYGGLITGAMDYMRIKVGDFALAQAYAPALEKMVELMERATVEETERMKKVRQEEENVRKAKTNKKWASKQLAAAGAAAAAAAATVETHDVPATESNARSVWSASESEDGWETSDYEE